MTQCKGHHGHKTAEITLLCHKVLCFLYTISITSVQKGHKSYSTDLDKIFKAFSEDKCGIAVGPADAENESNMADGRHF